RSLVPLAPPARTKGPMRELCHGSNVPTEACERSTLRRMTEKASTSEIGRTPTTPRSGVSSMLAPIERSARLAEARLRPRRAILWAAKALACGLVAAVGVLVLRKTGILTERAARVGLAIAVAQVLVVACVAYLRRLPRRAGAVALDRFHGLADRLSSALSFG